MPAKTRDVMYELQPLLELAILTFGSRIPSADEIANWLSTEAARVPLAPAAITQDVADAIREQGNSGAVLPYQRGEHAPSIVGLDPVTGGVIIAGLTALLHYFAGERRHKESLQGKPPLPPIELPRLPQEDLCKKEFEGRPCGYPYTASKVVVGGNYVLRRCSRLPQSHWTIIKP